ncbi:hypothetical protein OR16_41536 [Cupriavidus basilensis OR16]|uniref:DUF4123 domain-containing protein n=1 Tax=Cupriavidus basilensis OR16 TaxID=1127483 RepID=H1SII3_9BURK|nr:DUF4123 domain-containing protein [Cupriavidus basilensis]EHP37675.1 hypothetical protein OR16_41536 [Cupriavidus basilensis OR16]
MTAILQRSDAKEVASLWAAFQSRVETAHHEYDQLDLSTHLYALVDTRGLPDLREALGRLGSIPFSALWDGTDLSAFRDIAPLLIKVDLGAADADVPRQLLKRLWRFSNGGFMVTWIWTPHGLEELADHFRGYCEYTLSDRRAFYLHFYDNRILERLRLTWTQDEWTRFASVAFEIWYRNRSGEDGSWSADTLSQPGGEAPLQLSDEQHLRLHSLGYADKVAMQLTEVYGVLLEHLSSDALYLAVHTQIERATRYGVRDELDMLWYVAKGLLVSPQFDEHPLIHPKLLAASYGRISFPEALSLVGDACREDFKKVETI